jgi:hypothetical protein
MPSLLDKISREFSGIAFRPGTTFMWSPSNRAVYYDKTTLSSLSGSWSLLHELGHAVLDHQTYRDDLELLIMEVEAWSKAKELARGYGLSIKEGHIEKCVDSYRLWLHKRSKCIDCGTHSLQQDRTTYLCHNCGAKWKVPESKICQIRRTRISQI